MSKLFDGLCVVFLLTGPATSPFASDPETHPAGSIQPDGDGTHGQGQPPTLLVGSLSAWPVTVTGCIRPAPDPRG